MKRYPDSKLKYNTFLQKDYPNLGWTPSQIDLCETFEYFITKYNEGISKKSRDYYYFWLSTQYPFPDKEEINNGI